MKVNKKKILIIFRKYLPNNSGTLEQLLVRIFNFFMHVMPWN